MTDHIEMTASVTEEISAVEQRRRDLRRSVGLLLAVVVIAILHAVTDRNRLVLQEVYSYLCYFPIILAAYWYGAWGGLVTAIVTSLAYVPHLRAMSAAGETITGEHYVQLVVFHLLGLTVGVLAGAQQRLTARYRDAATALSKAHTHLLESQESLRRADRLRALGEIAAGLAHELQNPLAAVKGACDIVASRVTPGTPEGEFADIARKELGRLEGLVGEFLAYARPRAPDLRPAPLSPVFEHVLTLLRPEAQRRGVRLEVERPSDEPPLRVDTEQMTQVLVNVVLNALQASPSGGVVVMKESIDDHRAVIDVIDDGPGIAAEHRAQIFEPFFTTKTRGTGLGLAISSRIVAAHAGSIEALPRGAAGTIMRIQLPLADVETRA